MIHHSFQSTGDIFLSLAFVSTFVTISELFCGECFENLFYLFIYFIYLLKIYLQLTVNKKYISSISKSNANLRQLS